MRALLENPPWKTFEAAARQDLEEVLRKLLYGHQETTVGEDEDCGVGHQLSNCRNHSFDDEDK